MEFEWDEEKRESNLRKHGIDFEYAKDIWNGATIESPAGETQGESRIKAIGRFGYRILAIVYTERGGKRRLISARPASRAERAHYDREIG
ncbi:MAG: hypothetical protein C5B58_10960 [Acidobacteria bacterium]|nr:MAG: hypothetical protein C5B58_10960 [Acidobacteriota bacterium]